MAAGGQGKAMAVTDFNVLPFYPILSDVHNPICLQLCSNIASVNNLNVSVDLDITNDSDIVIACEGESIVKPRWASDRVPVFTEKLDDNSIDELLNGLEDIDHQNTNIVIINTAVDDSNNIIKNAAEHADMFVKINNSSAHKNLKRQNLRSKRYFNSDYYVKRKEYRKSKKYFYRVRSTINYKDMVCKNKECKKILKMEFNEYQKAFVSKLRGLRTTDPKSY
ncbi:unnamed protein product [Mytilus coruscus]|uniref:Uncharacterized protein n=1 Tax=Mytilus coruscus TaxID=42192 RepID=A0A6J8C8G0_MYTCO|nr:unnamed protein product [Mytilus coruscus]